MPRVLFASWHGMPDSSSGAAVATRDLLGLLAGRGWAVRVLTGSRTDFPHDEDWRVRLAGQGVAFEEQAAGAFSLLHFKLDRLPCSVFLPAAGSGDAEREAAYRFVQAKYLPSDIRKIREIASSNPSFP